jgi:lipoprotein signal peptidase
VFILYALVAGLIVGVAVGGRPSALASIQFRWAPLILVGFLAQVVLFTDAVASRIGGAGPPIYVVTTVMVGAAVLRNIGLPGLPLIVLGALSNLVAILANGGFMPATPDAVASLGKHGAVTIYSNSSLVASPSLAPLVDRFALPQWLPFANVFSIGDVLIASGVIVLIVATMRRPAEPAPRGEPEGEPTAA